MYVNTRHLTAKNVKTLSYQNFSFYTKHYALHVTHLEVSLKPGHLRDKNIGCCEFVPSRHAFGILLSFPLLFTFPVIVPKLILYTSVYHTFAGDFVFEFLVLPIQT